MHVQHIARVDGYLYQRMEAHGWQFRSGDDRVIGGQVMCEERFTRGPRTALCLWRCVSDTTLVAIWGGSDA